MKDITDITATMTEIGQAAKAAAAELAFATAERKHAAHQLLPPLTVLLLVVGQRLHGRALRVVATERRQPTQHIGAGWAQDVVDGGQP